MIRFITKKIKIVVGLEHKDEILEVTNHHFWTSIETNEFLDIYIITGTILMDHYQTLIDILEKFPFDVCLDI